MNSQFLPGWFGSLAPSRFYDHPRSFLIKDLVVLKQNCAPPASHYGNKSHNVGIASTFWSCSIEGEW